MTAGHTLYCVYVAYGSITKPKCLLSPHRQLWGPLCATYQKLMLEVNATLCIQQNSMQLYLPFVFDMIDA